MIVKRSRYELRSSWPMTASLRKAAAISWMPAVAPSQSGSRPAGRGPLLGLGDPAVDHQAHPGPDVGGWAAPGADHHR